MMGLAWDITKIDDYKNKCWVEVEGQDKRTLNPTTDALIWACMSINMRGITETNTEEFYTRYLMASHAMERDSRECWLTLEDIEDHIGLGTNVTTRTKAQFHKQIAQDVRDTAERQIRWDKEKRESAEGGEE